MYSLYSKYKKNTEKKLFFSRFFPLDKVQNTEKIQFLRGFSAEGKTAHMTRRNILPALPASLLRKIC